MVSWWLIAARHQLLNFLLLLQSRLLSQPQRNAFGAPALQLQLTTMTSHDTPGESKYVTLVSSDGFEFVILREAACKSGAIRRMLDPKSELPSLFQVPVS